MNANWRDAESPNVVYLHRATLLDEDVAYPIEPSERTPADDRYRANALRWVLLVDALAFAAMGALIWLY